MVTISFYHYKLDYITFNRAYKIFQVTLPQCDSGRNTKFESKNLYEKCKQMPSDWKVNTYKRKLRGIRLNLASKLHKRI